ARREHGLPDRRVLDRREQLDPRRRIPPQPDAQSYARVVDVDLLAREAAEVVLGRVVGELPEGVELRTQLVHVADRERGGEQIELAADGRDRERARDDALDVDDGRRET